MSNITDTTGNLTAVPEDVLILNVFAYTVVACFDLKVFKICYVV